MKVVRRFGIGIGTEFFAFENNSELDKRHTP